jgi:hypothetical protein
MSDFIIDPEFESYLPERDAATFAELESLLLEEGIKDPLTIALIDGQSYLIDGFGRYSIAQKHNLKFSTRQKKFKTKEDALYYMDRLQRARRNISGKQLSECICRMVSHLKNQGKCGIVQQVAEDMGLEERTVYRHLAEGKALQQLPPDLRKRLTSGEIKASREDVIELATLEEPQQRQVFIEADADGEKDIGVVLHGTIDLEEIEQKGRSETDFATAHHEKGNVKELRNESLTALGKLSKALDALDSAEPNSARMSSFRSHVEGIRKLIQGWEKVAA